MGLEQVTDCSSVQKSSYKGDRQRTTFFTTMSEWPNDGFWNNAAYAMTRVVSTVCAFHTRLCPRPVRRAGFGVASGQMIASMTDTKLPFCARLHCWKRIYSYINQVFVIFICATWKENDLTTSVVSVANTLWDLKDGIGLKCPYLRLHHVAHGNHSLGFRCLWQSVQEVLIRLLICNCFYSFCVYVSALLVFRSSMDDMICKCNTFASLL